MPRRSKGKGLKESRRIFIHSLECPYCKKKIKVTRSLTLEKKRMGWLDTIFP